MFSEWFVKRAICPHKYADVRGSPMEPGIINPRVDDYTARLKVRPLIAGIPSRWFRTLAPCRKFVLNFATHQGR